MQRLEFLYPRHAGDGSASMSYRISLTEANGREHILDGFGQVTGGSLQQLARSAVKKAEPSAVHRAAPPSFVRS